MKNKKQHSKYAIATILFFSTILVICFCVRVYRIYRLPESYIEITGTAVDNRFNNYVSEYNVLHTTGDFVRVGNKIYYNYYGSYATYGLYEITSDGARRIHWDGYGPWAFLTGHDIKLYPIQEYNGELIMNTMVDGNYYVYKREIKEWELAQGGILSYNKETQTFEETVLFGGVSDIAYLTYQETAFGFVYRSKDLTDLWVYTKEGDSVRIASEDIYSFYTVGQQIYYIAGYVLHMFDWDTKTDTIICEWPDYVNMSNIIIEDSQLIFMATHKAENTRSVYKLDLKNPKDKEKVIYTIETSNTNLKYIYCFNVWDGTVYICGTQGLMACDLDTGTHRVLCDKPTDICYIVDDTWVYFEEDDTHALWRVPQKGGAAELVLG